MELAGLSTEWLVFLLAVSVTAGLLDTLAGGGGLLTVPALIMSGMPPLSALATNKLQGSVGTATATFYMFRHKRVRWQDVKRLMLAAFIGSLLGTIALQFINSAILTWVIPCVLFAIACYFLLTPTPKETERTPLLSQAPYGNIVVPSIGFYDGMFGPGTGSFYAMSGVLLRGHGLLKSTAVAKTLNFSTNIASLLVFLISGHILWVVGAIMMMGQALGAYLGAHSLFRIDPHYLRVLIVIMCFSMLVRYIVVMG